MLNFNSVKAKILGLSLISVLVTAVVLVCVVLYKQIDLKDGINEEMMKQGHHEIEAITIDARTLCQTTDLLVRGQVQSAVELAREKLSRLGEPRLAGGTTERQTAAGVMDVPRLEFGTTCLNCTKDLNEYTPVVDDVYKQVGIHCSIFQRLNDQGDMLRIASSANKDGKRLTGSISKALMADGSPNMGIKKVLAGESHIGITQLTGSLKITKFEPLLGADGEVIGMLACGFNMSQIKILRESIINTVVGKTGYVFVLQGSGENMGTYIISANGESDGKNILDVPDADGNLFVADLIKLGKEAAEGEVGFKHYRWDNPETGHADNKMSAVAYYEPWDWVIGAGTYEADFQDAIQATERIIGNLILWVIIGAVLIIILIGVVSITVSNRIANPIIAAAHFADNVADGDLTQDIDSNLGDEVGRLIRSLKKMNKNLGGLVGTIGNTATGVSSSSEELTASATETARSIQEVTKTVGEVSEGSQTTTTSISVSTENMQQTALAVEGISKDIEEVAGYASQAATQGAEGLKAADGAVEIIDRAASSVRETATVVQALGEKTQQIGEFIGIITGIADQTNLLALNAAIEAARAGEAGRGFAVVAEEVRKLAEESNNSAGSITELVKAIEAEMQTALTAMNRSDEEVATGSETVQGASRLIGEIVAAVGALSDKVQSVSAAAEEINASTQEVLDSLQSVAAVAEENAAGSADVSAATEQQSAAMEQVSSSAAELSRLALEMEELVRRFRVEG